jgi:hypothetical protein
VGSDGPSFDAFLWAGARRFCELRQLNFLCVFISTVSFLSAGMSFRNLGIIRVRHFETALSHWGLSATRMRRFPATMAAPDLTVYHCPPTRSVRVVWVLEELGLPYKASLRSVFVPKYCLRTSLCSWLSFPCQITLTVILGLAS